MQPAIHKTIEDIQGLKRNQHCTNNPHYITSGAKKNFHLTQLNPHRISYTTRI